MGVPGPGGPVEPGGACGHCGLPPGPAMDIGGIPGPAGPGPPGPGPNVLLGGGPRMPGPYEPGPIGPMPGPRGGFILGFIGLIPGGPVKPTENGPPLIYMT
ncbi:hypothetical protein B566_EDAN001511 [Ephemera danica]|nr:hypothetical protein B566_EDAN001511 [Ephemera danica]